MIGILRILPNEQTTLDYIQKIILPYICRKKKEMNLLANQHSLCIFDNFKAQLTAWGSRVAEK